MGKKGLRLKYEKFDDETLERIKAKKLQEVEKQGPNNPKNSVSNLERKPKQTQTKKGQESSSKTAPEEKKAEVKIPESIHEVKNQIKIPKLPNKETSLSEGQTHHNVDKENAIQQVLVENDYKAYNAHTKVLDSNLTLSAENSQETLITNILDTNKEKKTVTLEDTRTEVKSPNTTPSNMELPGKDVQGSKPKPDNPAWINNGTGSVPFSGHPFSALNPNASEFRPGGCVGTTDSLTLSDVHPTLRREIAKLAEYPALPPGMLVQTDRMSTHASAQFPVQPFPRPFQKKTPSSLHEASLNVPVESTFFVEGPTGSYNPPVPELKNSTSAWKVEQIRTDTYPAQQSTGSPLHISQGHPTTTYVQPIRSNSAQLPQPSSHNPHIEPIHELPKVEPTNSSNNWSDEEYIEPNHNMPDQRQDWDSNSRFQGNQRDSFNRNSDRSRGFQDKRGARGGGRHFHEDKRDTRGGRGREKPLNEDRGFGRHNERFRPSEPERDQNSKESIYKDDRGGGRGRRYNEGKEFDVRREERFESDNSQTGQEHGRAEKKDDFYRNKNWTERTSDNVRNSPDFESTRGRGRRQNDSWKGNNTRQNRSNENRSYGPRGDSRPFQRDQNRNSLERELHSSGKDKDTRQNINDNAESTVEISRDKESKLFETTNRSGLSWRDRSSDDSNKCFTKHRDDNYRDRDANNPRYSNNRARGAYGNSRDRGDVQHPRGGNSNFGRGIRGGRGKENVRGRHSSIRTNHNEDEVRRNSIEEVEIATDDSSKDSTDKYHITDEDSSEVPEKIVELEVKSPESLLGTSDMSHNSEIWDDWNDSVDTAAETALELSEWNAWQPSEVEVKPETQSSVENIFQEEETSIMPKRRWDKQVLERDKHIQGTSRNSSHRSSDRRNYESQRRSLEPPKKPIDLRMEREKQNRSADSVQLESDWSASSSGTRTFKPRFKQTRITSYTTGREGEREPFDKEFDRWEKTWMTIKDLHVVQEIQGNLFEQPKDFSLAHCVAEDLRMGSGIAVDFKREFKNVDDLLDQRVRQGGLALLWDEGTSRFVYYLVTKRESTGKPTYLTLWKSLNKMRDHIKENEVKKLAIPRLACGLDRLEWNKVKSMIEHLFSDVDVEIKVCNFQQDEELTKKSWSTCKLFFQETPITKIETGTLIFYFTTANGDVDENMLEMAKKFNFLPHFKSYKSKNLGEIIYSEDKGYGLCGCIVRKSRHDKISFKSLLRCVREFNKKNKSFKSESFDYVALQEVKEEDYNDDLINQKILTILINFLYGVDVYVCSGTFNDSS